MAERDPLLDAVIGHYTIDTLIGEGGMGRVYLAHHTNLPNRRYAFKVLLGDHSASVAMRARFTREAERASQLDHPNVVRVVDFGQTRHGLLYIVMDYVDGPALITLIDKAPMAPAHVIALSRAICKGLVYAHAAGIVHRDLKPENILVSTGPEGLVPRIVDFGLALSVDQSDTRLTESGMTMGTPAFAAPEQLSGKAIDHRADLYALGMTMFEMLTGGMAPFEGHIYEVMSARAARDVPRVSERVPHLGIPRELDDIVARLTRRKPAERYASAREVIDALDCVRLGPQARKATVAVRPRSGRSLWLAAGVLAACGGAAAAWYAIDIGRAAAPPPGVPGLAASVPAPAAVPERVDPAPPVAAPAAASEIAEPAPGASAPAVPAAPASAPAAPPTAPPRVAAPVRHHHRPRAARPPSPAAPVVAVPPSEVRAAPLPVLPAAPLPVLPAAPPPPPPPPPPPRELRAMIDGVDVSGSLPPGVVQRAVERRWSAIARCMPAAPEIVVAHFTIGEARRALGVRATGATAETNACIISAFSDVRTEAAPDVGNVEVTVRIAFVVKT